MEKFEPSIYWNLITHQAYQKKSTVDDQSSANLIGKRL